jgi:hypothetical protein
MMGSKKKNLQLLHGSKRHLMITCQISSLLS